MKMLNLISAIVLLGFTMSAHAENYKFVVADNSIDSKMCLDAVTNDRSALQHSIRKSGATVRWTARHLKCNDQIVANFAYRYNASDTFALLNRYTLKKDKQQRPAVTIKDLAAVQGKTVVVLIASN